MRIRKPLTIFAILLLFSAIAFVHNGVAAESASGTPGSEVGAEDVLPAGSVKFMGLPVVQALRIYADLSRTEMEVAPGVKELPVLITFENKTAMKRAELVQEFDAALLAQAGIVVKHPDNKHAVIRLRTSVDEKK